MVILVGGLGLAYMLAGGELSSQRVSPVDKAIVTIFPGEDGHGQASLQMQSFTGVTGPPTPTPTNSPEDPTPASTIGGSSGQPMPSGDMPGWKLIFSDDFTKDAAIGSWGSECDSEKIAYLGAQGQKWRSYPKCFKDTYQKRPYRADQVLSVKNGMMNFFLHPVDGQPAGANPSPVITGTSQYQTYGRYVARFRTDTADLGPYYVAWLLWPQSEKWPDDGEEDFPEGALRGNAGGFHHYAGGGACVGCQDGASSNAKFTEWHTYTMEWSPNRIKYILDGQEILNSTKWVPTKPMRWQLQTETNGNGNQSGNLMVDWVAVYAYQP
ncbi:MAG: glycoside hydrolase family 16 protein [Candidatus Levybacteria bacterium]|nr:glycoside hydrolase family 16 protein [Candidatus Levybacteria bacterium]